MGTDLQLRRRLDAVELKVTIRREASPRAMKALGLDADGGTRRRIYFCEGAAAGAGATLLDQGIILRLRETDDDDADSTVKFRPFETRRLTDRWRKTKKFAGGELKVEADWVSEAPVVAVSVGATYPAGEANAAASGLRPLAGLFSATQQEFLAEHAGEWVEVGDLRVLGPIDAVKWEPSRRGFPRDLVAEHWRVDDLEFLELSVRVEHPDDAPEVRQQFQTFLGALDLLGDVENETKTRTVLGHLSRSR